MPRSSTELPLSNRPTHPPPALGGEPHSGVPQGGAPKAGEGLLLVGHGTRDAIGTDQFFQLADVLAERIAPVPVQGCLLELQQPDIPEGWRRLVSRGARHVRVVPLLLFTAGHARRDIPEAVAAAAEQSPGVTYSFARPLSRHANILDLVVRRIHAATSDSLGSTAVVMIGRGSYDPCARTDMFLLSETVRRRLGLPVIETGFYAMAEPRLPTVLERAAVRPGVRRVVVYPHLLFEGQLYAAIQQQVAAAAQRHGDRQFHVASYLGPEPDVAEAIWDRATATCLPQV